MLQYFVIGLFIFFEEKKLQFITNMNHVYKIIMTPISVLLFHH